MAKKPNENDARADLAQAEERIEVIKGAIAQALVQRNTLPKSASDEEKAAVAARVVQLQAQHHEAAQQLLAIKRQETTKLEREHKEKKLRHKQLKASRQPSSHVVPDEKHASPPRRSSARLPMDRDVEEALMDAANEEDLFLLRRQQEEKDNEGVDELAHHRELAKWKREKEEAAARQETEKCEREKAEAKVEAARLKAEKEADAKIRQQAALQRAEETKTNKRKQRTEREAQLHAAQNARSPGWFGDILRQLKAFFGPHE